MGILAATPLRCTADLASLLLMRAVTLNSRMTTRDLFDHNIDRPDTWHLGGQSDEIVHVLEGALSLASARNTVTLQAGELAILPKGIRCRAQASSGYRGLHAKWGA